MTLPIKPGLILLDWEMPKLTGIDTLPIMRKMNTEVLIVMMTSKNAMSDVIEAIERGATDYIMKPFTKDILLNKIEQVSGKKVL